ncbi:hypothetical protein L2E82_05814 [Cichorium intybus]|uniref:Uncharacterized protein n=1 Tax=Cichorium intybus TaxID=13427 RepID=A0ACB9H7W1_CICIN|nr:hypothetical protein L2E82_05814 [Cichorium intybus]
MAVITFTDLHTEAGLRSLESFLSGKTYISGNQITKDDVKVYAAVLEKPSADLYPSASKWYDCVASKLSTSFPGKAVGVRVSTQAPSAEAALVNGVTNGVSQITLVDADEDDDLDLFADETEEEKKAAEARDQAKASTKKKESGKSSVLMDVKPWDDETDMKKLEEAVRSVQMEGLLWGASKLVPVGYGIKKMTIMMTIVDDLVSVDTLIEERLTVEPINEYVQSCDIVAFNKI